MAVQSRFCCLAALAHDLRHAVLAIIFKCAVRGMGEGLNIPGESSANLAASAFTYI